MVAAVSVASRVSVSASGDGSSRVIGSVRGGGFVNRSISGSVSVSGSSGGSGYVSRSVNGDGSVHRSLGSSSSGSGSGIRSLACQCE